MSNSNCGSHPNLLFKSNGETLNSNLSSFLSPKSKVPLDDVKVISLIFVRLKRR